MLPLLHHRHGGRGKAVINRRLRPRKWSSCRFVGRTRHGARQSMQYLRMRLSGLPGVSSTATRVHYCVFLCLIPVLISHRFWKVLGGCLGTAILRLGKPGGNIKAENAVASWITFDRYLEHRRRSIRWLPGMQRTLYVTPQTVHDAVVFARNPLF